jgi:hypothetical protein
VPQEVGDGTDLLDELVTRLFGVRSGTRTATLLINFMYDRGDLVGGGAGVGLGE